MTDAVLTKVQGVTLLQELISNDAFRRRFAEKPAAALLEIGIPAETIVNLNPTCLAPVQNLANAAALQTALDALAKDGAHACLSMWVPSVKI